MLTNHTKKAQKNFFSTIDYMDQIDLSNKSFVALSKSAETKCNNLLIPSLSKPLEIPHGFNMKQILTGPLRIVYSHDLPVVAYHNNKQMAVLVRSHLKQNMFII